MCVCMRAFLYISLLAHSIHFYYSFFLFIYFGIFFFGYEIKMLQKCGIVYPFWCVMCLLVFIFNPKQRILKFESAILMIFYYDYFHFYFLPLTRGTNFIHNKTILWVDVYSFFIPGVFFRALYSLIINDSMAHK